MAGGRVRSLTMLLALGLVAIALGCSSDGGADDRSTSGPAGTDGIKQGTAKIVRFEVPASVACPEPNTFTTVTVQYKTSGAARAELRVDGRPLLLAEPAGGSVTANVRCDPLPHDFVLVAYDDNDGLTVEERLLNTTR